MVANSIITTGSFPKALRPGLASIFGNVYDEKTAVWSQIFKTEASTKSYEEDLEASSFGLAVLKQQGNSVTFDADMQGDVIRTVHAVMGLGFIITEEEIDDNQYAQLSERRTENLGWSMRQTKEIIANNILNRAFDSSYTFGVNNPKELCSTSHTTFVGSQSNKLNPAADLSQASLQDMVTMVYNAKNNRGLRINLKAERLIVPNELIWTAQEVCNSVLQPGGANNNINSIYTMGVIPEILQDTYLTDTDAWFLQTNAPRGAIHYSRKPIAFSDDNDFATNNMNFKATERYSFTVPDWRAMYGSTGA
jgi:hypothetical protein